MPVETIKVSDNVVIEIHQDEDAESPANWDNLGEITYKGHGRHVLGTEAVDDDRFTEISRKIQTGQYIGIPVYAYVHGQATIKAAYENPFGCPWDSGWSGWVYTTREKALQEYGGKRITKSIREKVYSVLRAEVETFDQYLRGEVYGWVLKVDGEQVDSCWSYYGVDAAKSDALSEAQRFVEPAELA